MTSRLRARVFSRMSLLSALGVTACWNASYPPGFAGVMVGGNQHGPKQSGGSMPAVNAMSVPICEVVVTSAPAPDKSFINDNNGKVFLSPGEQKDISCPALHDLMQPTTMAELEKEGKQMNVVAYGCKKEAYEWAADESAMIFQQTGVTFDHNQKLVIH
jgi:pyruvate/2-oxoglutarate/acetoin dehydrogenase E1 component